MAMVLSKTSLLLIADVRALFGRVIWNFIMGKHTAAPLRGDYRVLGLCLLGVTAISRVIRPETRHTAAEQQ
jgi:hypothetical protein